MSAPSTVEPLWPFSITKKLERFYFSEGQGMCSKAKLLESGKGSEQAYIFISHACFIRQSCIGFINIVVYDPEIIKKKYLIEYESLKVLF